MPLVSDKDCCWIQKVFLGAQQVVFTPSAPKPGLGFRQATDAEVQLTGCDAWFGLCWSCWPLSIVTAQLAHQGLEPYVWGCEVDSYRSAVLSCFQNLSCCGSANECHMELGLVLEQVLTGSARVFQGC